MRRALESLLESLFSQNLYFHLHSNSHIGFLPKLRPIDNNSCPHVSSKTSDNSTHTHTHTLFQGLSHPLANMSQQHERQQTAKHTKLFELTSSCSMKSTQVLVHEEAPEQAGRLGRTTWLAGWAASWTGGGWSFHTPHCNLAGWFPLLSLGSRRMISAGLHLGSTCHLLTRLVLLLQSERGRSGRDLVAGGAWQLLLLLLYVLVPPTSTGAAHLSPHAPGYKGLFVFSFCCCFSESWLI